MTEVGRWNTASSWARHLAQAKSGVLDQAWNSAKTTVKVWWQMFRHRHLLRTHFVRELLLTQLTEAVNWESSSRQEPTGPLLGFKVLFLGRKQQGGERVFLRGKMYSLQVMRCEETLLGDKLGTSTIKCYTNGHLFRSCGSFKNQSWEIINDLG